MPKALSFAAGLAGGINEALQYEDEQNRLAERLGMDRERLEEAKRHNEFLRKLSGEKFEHRKGLDISQEGRAQETHDVTLPGLRYDVRLKGSRAKLAESLAPFKYMQEGPMGTMDFWNEMQRKQAAEERAQGRYGMEKERFGFERENIWPEEAEQAPVETALMDARLTGLTNAETRAFAEEARRAEKFGWTRKDEEVKEKYELRELAAESARLGFEMDQLSADEKRAVAKVSTLQKVATDLSAAKINGELPKGARERLKELTGKEYYLQRTDQGLVFVNKTGQGAVPFEQMESTITLLLEGAKLAAGQEATDVVSKYKLGIMEAVAKNIAGNPMVKGDEVGPAVQEVMQGLDPYINKLLGIGGGAGSERYWLSPTERQRIANLPTEAARGTRMQQNLARERQAYADFPGKTTFLNKLGLDFGRDSRQQSTGGGPAVRSMQPANTGQRPPINDLKAAAYERALRLMNIEGMTEEAAIAQAKREFGLP